MLSHFTGQCVRCGRTCRRLGLEQRTLGQIDAIGVDRAGKLISNVVEGLNNKAKVTRRRSYGFRTYRVLELAVYHSLGKRPEPESTPDFF